MATDKLKGFFEQAAQNPEILGEAGSLFGDKGGDNPLESLLVLFKQFTAK